MALHILKWRPSAPKFKVPNIGAIGEPDAHVFNCPKCARPLTEGTPRCPGCGTKLIMGVALQRAAVLIGFGFIVGMFIGGGLTSIVITTLINTPDSAAAAEPADGSTPSASVRPGGAAGASGAPVVVDLTIPVGALPSLRQASLLDARFAADNKALSKAYKAKSSAAVIAPILRSLATNASIGTDLLPQLRTWDAARKLVSDRNAFYAAVSSIAHNGLRDSLTDKKGFRASAKKMLATLRRLDAIDAASRTLALTGGVELPPVDLS
jgi:hypothetical protein